MEDVRRGKKEISQRAKEICMMDGKSEFVKTEEVSDGLFSCGQCSQSAKKEQAGRGKPDPVLLVSHICTSGDCKKKKKVFSLFFPDLCSTKPIYMTNQRALKLLMSLQSICHSLLTFCFRHLSFASLFIVLFAFAAIPQIQLLPSSHPLSSKFNL